MSSPISGREQVVIAILRATAELGAARAALSQAVAERFGLATTDVAVLRQLMAEGTVPVGRIGELTSLTTGATTRLIDRLEQAGYVRRLPDPADRRRVLVQPVRDRCIAVTAAFDPADVAFRQMLDPVSDEALVEIREFLEASAEATRAHVQEFGAAPASRSDVPTQGDAAVAAPIASATSGRLVFVTGAPHVTIGSDPGLGAELYRARFAGAIPSARVRDGAVTIRFPRFAWFDWRMRIGDNRVNASGHWRRDATDVVLNTALPWRIEFRGGVSSATLDLRAVRLEELTFSGGVGSIKLELGQPVGVVPITMSGGANDVTVSRPAGAALRIGLTGGFNAAVVDGQRLGGSNQLKMDTDGSPNRFELHATGGMNSLTVSRG
jgi:DNA-binding MarR family transcriptional regulator